MVSHLESFSSSAEPEAEPTSSKMIVGLYLNRDVIGRPEDQDTIRQALQQKGSERTRFDGGHLMVTATYFPIDEQHQLCLTFNDEEGHYHAEVVPTQE